MWSVLAHSHYLQPLVSKYKKKTKKNPCISQTLPLTVKLSDIAAVLFRFPSSITALLTLADIMNLRSELLAGQRKSHARGKRVLVFATWSWSGWDGCLPPPDALYFSVSATGTQRDCKQIGPYLCVEMGRRGVGGSGTCSGPWSNLVDPILPLLLFHTDAAALHCTNWWKSDPRLFPSNLPPTSRGSYHRMANTAKKQAYLERKWFGEGFVFAKRNGNWWLLLGRSFFFFFFPTLPEWSVSCCMV